MRAKIAPCQRSLHAYNFSKSDSEALRVLAECGIIRAHGTNTIYRSQQTGETEAIRECKVIFLGDGGAGESSLIRRIMDNTFQSGEFSTTQGARVIPWKTELDGKPFLVRFMDFGGQEIMRSMRRCFLSNHTVYVSSVPCGTTRT